MLLQLQQTEQDVKASYVPLIVINNFPTFPTFVDGQSYDVQVQKKMKKGITLEKGESPSYVCPHG